MPEGNLEYAVIPSGSRSASLESEILGLCNLAYGEDLADLFNTFGAAVHVLGRIRGRLVSHAMWVTRWLQPGSGQPLETAYVEFVATHPAFQRHGYATAVMQRLIKEVPESYRLAALCPATSGIYERLGWHFWRGPLIIRMPSGPPRATPEERVMVRELPGRPALDLDAPLSAEWRAGELW